MIRNVLLLIGVLLVGAAAWLVDAMQLSPRAALSARDGSPIDALLAARSAFEVGVLEARAGLQQNFDPLNRAVVSLRDGSAAAAALQRRGPRCAPAAERLALAARAQEAEEAAVEQFKTDLTLLRLSSHYFPLAADALTRRAEADVRYRSDSPLARELTTLAALRTDVERYEELPAREGVQRMEQGLSKLQGLRPSLDVGAREELDVLSGHTRAILDRRERVDGFARRVARSPVRAHLEAARAEYERSARGYAWRVGALQVVSAVLALAGVGVLVGVVLRGLPRRAG